MFSRIWKCLLFYSNWYIALETEEVEAKPQCLLKIGKFETCHTSYAQLKIFKQQFELFYNKNAIQNCPHRTLIWRINWLYEAFIFIKVLSLAMSKSVLSKNCICNVFGLHWNSCRSKLQNWNHKNCRFSMSGLQTITWRHRHWFTFEQSATLITQHNFMLFRQH